MRNEGKQDGFGATRKGINDGSDEMWGKCTK